MDVVFPIETDGEVTLRNYAIKYHPFTAAELTHRLGRAGFTDVQAEERGRGFLQVVGKAART